jgi:hypothetical protein
MSAPELFQTPMGRRFYESTLPDIAVALLRIASALEKPMKFDVATRTLLDVLANAGHGECYCRVHRGDCPSGDCDGCLQCPTGRARSIIVEHYPEEF